jgi:hypothetical protein
MREFRAFLILIVAILVVFGVVGWLAWRLMGLVEPDTARAWALLATVLATVLPPAAAWAGYKVGHLQADGRMQGIDDGLEKVVTAAQTAIDLRVQNITKIKEATREPAPYIVLPPPEPAFRMLEASERAEFIELE